MYPNVQMNNQPAMVQIMAWHRKGDKAIVWINYGLIYYTYVSFGRDGQNTNFISAHSSITFSQWLTDVEIFDKVRQCPSFPFWIYKIS